MSEVWTYPQIFDGLRARYSSPSYVLFTEVSNGVGSPSRMDALAMAMWRSHGLDIHGFEIKTSRRDWLSEIKRPFKSDYAYSHCDRWWLVVSDLDIVKDGELPPTWGLLAPRGDQLCAVKKASLLKAKPLDHEFVAAILRKAAQLEHPAWRQFEFRPATTEEEIQRCFRSISQSIANVSRRLDHIDLTVNKLKTKTQPESESAMEQAAQSTRHDS